MSETPVLDLTDLRYPIGRFTRLPEFTVADRNDAIAVLAELPEKLRISLDGLSDEQLDTPYRDGGWTVRQLVHHVADSHMNAYVRVHLALTEDWPAIKPYDEAEWAELEDARTLPVAISWSLLDSLHKRWVFLLRSLNDSQWRRGYTHPQMGRQALDQVAALYSWHSRHHTAHITALRQRMMW